MTMIKEATKIIVFFTKQFVDTTVNFAIEILADDYEV
jgi:hypothetical protein